VKVNLEWIESEVFESEDPAPISKTCTAFSFPAGSASAAPKARSPRPTFARERKVPYFGICFGMQMAVLEAARNLAGIENASRPNSARRRSRLSA
jgi:CTP synthase